MLRFNPDFFFANSLNFSPNFCFPFFLLLQIQRYSRYSPPIIVLIEDDKNYPPAVFFFFFSYFELDPFPSTPLISFRPFSQVDTPNSIRSSKNTGVPMEPVVLIRHLTVGSRWNLSSDQLYAAILTLSRSPRYAKNGK